MEEEIRFCPNCGHEGHDVECPICLIKMESLDAEIEKLAEAEKDDEEKDITDVDTQVSLEEAEKEEENSEA